MTKEIYKKVGKKPNDYQVAKKMDYQPKKRNFFFNLFNHANNENYTNKKFKGKNKGIVKFMNLSKYIYY